MPEIYQEYIGSPGGLQQEATCGCGPLLRMAGYSSLFKKMYSVLRVSIFKWFCKNRCPENLAIATADVVLEGNFGLKMSKKIGKIMKIFDKTENAKE